MQGKYKNHMVFTIINLKGVNSKISLINKAKLIQFKNKKMVKNFKAKKTKKNKKIFMLVKIFSTQINNVLKIEIFFMIRMNFNNKKKVKVKVKVNLDKKGRVKDFKNLKIFRNERKKVINNHL